MPVTTSVTYCLWVDLDRETLLSQLESVGTWRQFSPTDQSVTFFDTFDWRLHANGRVLEQTAEKSPHQLILRKRGDDRPLATSSGPLPKFVVEMPGDELGRQLSSIVEMRALFPIAKIDRKCWTLECLNAEHKTTLRMHWEALEVRPLDGGSPVTIPGRLSLVPVRGYPKPAEKARQVLQQFELQPAAELLDIALDALGQTPQQYTSKPNVSLAPEMPTGNALLLILRRLLETLDANEAGTRADLDSEFLHDFRVAVRRTRAILSQTKQVMPDALRQHFREEFAWLGQVTGPTRDLDVYLLQFPEYQASLPEGMRLNLQPLRLFLAAQQRREQRALARQLNGRRYRALLAKWRGWLDEPEFASATAGKAQQAVGKFADKRIAKVFALVLQEGEAIGEQSPATDLHDLRKTCKKLRYLMEFFQSLYPTADIVTLIKALKALQDNLGNFQDLAIQADAMRDFAETMLAKKPAPVATVLAMGTLSGELLQRQQQYRNRFAKQFGQFASTGNRRLVATLFTAPSHCGGKSKK